MCPCCHHHILLIALLASLLPHVFSDVSIVLSLRKKNYHIIPLLAIGWNSIDSIAYKIKSEFSDKRAFIWLSVFLMFLKCCLTESHHCSAMLEGFLMHRDLCTHSSCAALLPLQNSKFFFLLTKDLHNYPSRNILLPYIQAQHYLIFSSDQNKPYFSLFFMHMSISSLDCKFSMAGITFSLFL